MLCFSSIPLYFLLATWGGDRVRGVKKLSGYNEKVERRERGEREERERRERREREEREKREKREKREERERERERERDWRNGFSENY